MLIAINQLHPTALYELFGFLARRLVWTLNFPPHKLYIKNIFSFLLSILDWGKWKIISSTIRQILAFDDRIAENISVYDDPVSVNFNVVKKYKLVQKPTQK